MYFALFVQACLSVFMVSLVFWSDRFSIVLCSSCFVCGYLVIFVFVRLHFALGCWFEWRLLN